MDDNASSHRFMVPTYVPDYDLSQCHDFQYPRVPVEVSYDDGVVVDLGEIATHGCRPSIVIERRANGWMIVLIPDGGDASGMVYFLDNGKSFVETGCSIPCESNIVMVDKVPEELDEKPPAEATTEMPTEVPTTEQERMRVTLQAIAEALSYNQKLT